MKKIIVVLLFGLGSLFACTSFVLKQEGSLYLSKNLDWEVDRGYLVYNLDGIAKTSISDTSLIWTSKYRSITNNQFGKEFPLGGLNEAGLVIEEMSLFGQPYVYDEGKLHLNEFQWVQYQLDRSASVEEVIASLDTVNIKHAFMNLHYLVADRSGDMAVIECLEQGITVYRGKDLPYPVLSNNPYLQALRYLGFYAGYGGDMEVMHRQGSQERFVSCVHLLNSDNDVVLPIDFALDLLETVKQNDTRWQFVYDLDNLTITYKTHDLAGESTIDLKALRRIKHNRYGVSLFGGKHKQTKISAEKNKAQLEHVHNELEAFFPGRNKVYEMMDKAGKESLGQK